MVAGRRSCVYRLKSRFLAIRPLGMTILGGDGKRVRAIKNATREGSRWLIQLINLLYHKAMGYCDIFAEIY